MILVFGVWNAKNLAFGTPNANALIEDWVRLTQKLKQVDSFFDGGGKKKISFYLSNFDVE